jgi:hypothetical protein
MIMRHYPVISLLILAAAVRSHAANPSAQLQQGDYVAVVGDSWAAVYGRPELAPEPYCTFLEAFLVGCKPAPDLSVTQFGYPQTTSYGYAFYGGAGNDVLRFHPTVATLWFGMSESGWTALTPEREKSIRDGLTLLVQVMKKGNVRQVVVGSPGYVDETWKVPAQAATMNNTFAAIRDIAKEVAGKEGAVFADIFGTMREATAKGKAKYGREFALSGGDVWRANRAGQLIMAYTLLKALGCDGNLGTITVDLAAGKAEASEGHKVRSAEKGEIQIESVRYPFCLCPGPAKPDWTHAVPEIVPFHEDLNRFRLVVRNIGTAKAAVTWGSDSKQFSAGQLEKGINLAAEFADNPFRELFQKLEQRIQEQQKVETVLSNVLMNRLRPYVALVPDLKQQTEQLAPAIAKRSKGERDATAAVVKSLLHTIKIIPVK